MYIRFCTFWNLIAQKIVKTKFSYQTGRTPDPLNFTLLDLGSIVETGSIKLGLLDPDPYRVVLWIYTIFHRLILIHKIITYLSIMGLAVFFDELLQCLTRNSCSVYWWTLFAVFIDELLQCLLDAHCSYMYYVPQNNIQMLYFPRLSFHHLHHHQAKLCLRNQGKLLGLREI